MSTIHLRDSRADRHPCTYGDGKTWCGRKLIGKPDEQNDGTDTFIVYGNRLEVTRDLDQGTCEHCRAAFDRSYNAAFPEGPKPIVTFKLDDPADMELARNVIGADALNRYFSPGGGGLPALDAALHDAARAKGGAL